MNFTEDSPTNLTNINSSGTLTLVSAGQITDSVGGSATLTITSDVSLTGAGINLADDAGDMYSIGGNLSLVALGGDADRRLGRGDHRRGRGRLGLGYRQRDADRYQLQSGR